MFHHCADYAMEIIAEHTDHEIVTQEVEYPFNQGVGIMPETLGQDLVNNYGATYAPGSNPADDDDDDDEEQ
ncbi:MAG: hypothetical protein AAF802_07935 [Planctomycetota bacterium]